MSRVFAVLAVIAITGCGGGDLTGKYAATGFSEWRFVDDNGDRQVLHFDVDETVSISEGTTTEYAITVDGCTLHYDGTGFSKAELVPGDRCAYDASGTTILESYQAGAISMTANPGALAATGELRVLMSSGSERPIGTVTLELSLHALR